MEHKAQVAYSHTADYRVIEIALKARWEPFCKLEEELLSFRPRTDFTDYRNSELSRLKQLNPTSSDEELLKLIDGQIASKADPSRQIYFHFFDRVMSEYVTVAFLSHALAEATINAILAIGLATNGTSELFALIERSDIKEKWIAGPKAFHPSYELRKDAALFQTLQHLVRQRNAFVHHKIELEMEGEKKIQGSRIDRSPLHIQADWIRRFFSLPYDLAAHATKQLPHHIGFVLFENFPIELYSQHSQSHGSKS